MHRPTGTPNTILSLVLIVLAIELLVQGLTRVGRSPT